MDAAIRSLPGVCEVVAVRGAAAAPERRPDLLLEVPHGATLASHFDELRNALRGRYGDDLRDFFFVNTDVGAPEVAVAVAEQVVRAQPHRAAIVVRSLVPRTFVDCNRAIDPSTPAAGSAAGEPTPGLPPWIRDPYDREQLLRRYFDYRAVATAAFEFVCGGGGFGLCVHTYAPRSIDVAVDEQIGRSLRAAYAPERLGTWPLRPPIDLITHDPDGRELAAPQLARATAAAYEQAGFEVERNGAYSLHPATLAREFAVRHPGRTLCLEIRRDLLLAAFEPFVELHPVPRLVERAAAPLASAVLQVL